MKSTGLVFREKPSIGIEPTRLYDGSRFGNHLTHTNITMVRLPSGLWVRNFNGSSYAKKTIADWRSSDSVGAIKVWLRSSSVTNYQDLFSSSSEASETISLEFAIEQTSGLLYVYQDRDSVKDFITGSTNVCDGKWHHVILISSGTAYTILLDAVVEDLHIRTGTNSGDWFADTAGRDNIMIGAIERTTAPTNRVIGDIAAVEAWNYPPSAGQIKKIFENERHYFGV